MWTPQVPRPRGFIRVEEFRRVNTGRYSDCYDNQTKSQYTLPLSLVYTNQTIQRTRQGSPMASVNNAIPQPADSEGTLKALLNSFFMIIFSEIGDKTFLIAAILAMRHPRLVVFAGAFGSLVVMSILSAAMGHILPTLIPKQWTQVAAAVLFLVFGSKMMMEGRAMKAGNEKIQEEMREAEEEIEGDDAGHDGTGTVASNGEVIPLEEMEAGGRVHGPRSPGSSVKEHGWAEGARNFCSFFLGPVFVQAFILTFLGEWGDRSQIATIALGAAHVCSSAHILYSHLTNPLQNVYLVTVGTVIGHSMCTALAVIGGRYVSTKISVKHGTYFPCLSTANIR